MGAPEWVPQTKGSIDSQNTIRVRRETPVSGLLRDSGGTGVLAVQGSCEARVLGYPPKGVAADCVLYEVSMLG